ncbi:hypothetical protein D3C78_1143140 [compost metagenome]
MFQGVTLRIRGLGTVDISIPETLTRGMIEGVDEHRTRQPFDVQDMRILEDGFYFLVDIDDDCPSGYFRISLEKFSHFLEDLERCGMKRDKVLTLEGAKAAVFVPLYRRWITEQFASECERAIRSGELTFEEARKIRKEVFDVPWVRKFFAECFKSGNMPQGKKGKRTKHRREVEELYALACRIYRENPDHSWEAACYLATEQRPGLVPASWETDPDGNLKREAARYWDKSPYSQLSFRQSRVSAD